MERAILVTGASSGIGRCLTERLSALGHRVYATARKARDLAALAEIENVVPIRLDLRRPQEIEEAARRVQEGRRELWGLVNNAGTGGIGPIAAWTDAELDSIFAVNALGPVRMSRAFLPLLLAARGRIVNIGSQGGSISKKYFGPYTMTKHALEAFTVALDEEVAPFGVRVSVVQPGGVVTAIGDNSVVEDLGRFRRAPAPFHTEAAEVARALERSPEPSNEGTRSGSAGADATGGPTSGETNPPAAHMRATGDEAAPGPDAESEENRKPSPPELVVDSVLHALFDEVPRRRYLVGTRWEGNRVLDLLFERVADANDSPSMGYRRDELVAWLDRKLLERGGQRAPQP